MQVDGEGSATLCDILTLDAETPAEQVDSEEFMRNLPKAIDALPPKYAQVIKMRNEQDLSYEEIASALNISVGTVKSRLSRAREYLRDELCKIV